MSLYGDINISLRSLKKWAGTLSLNGINQINVGGKLYQVDDEMNQILNLQLKGFISCVNSLKEGDDWRICNNCISSIFYNAFFRVNNNAIRFADYYESLLTPSNLKTYKKIIHGFDYVDVGEVNIRDESGKLIASVGPKSDLIWSVFFNYFVNENDDGSIEHTYANHEEILSIQLYDVEQVSQEKINALINEILLRISIVFDMNFKQFELNSLQKSIGDNTIRNIQFTPSGFDEIPMLYLNNAVNSSDERLSFLCYYQVMEYFFVRAQNTQFLSEFSALNLSAVNHNELRKVLTGYKKASSERESLKIVLQHAIDVSKFKIWIASDAKNVQQYCNSEMLKIDIQKDEKKIISALAERVYSYRCSIAHAKGDVEEYIAIPMLSSDKIRNELPLLKFLSFEVISYWSGR